MSIGEIICNLLSISNIDEEKGEKLYYSCDTWITETQKTEKRVHISIIRKKGNNCLYVYEKDILDVKIFTRLGAPSEYFFEYPKFFYKKNDD